MKIKQEETFWGIITIVGSVLFILNSSVFILLGRVNSDEGWYLYASKLVYMGRLPYKDFAFTQTPLLPYIYGIPQIFFQSLYLGRVTSAFFSIVAFILSWVIAKNYGGKMAGGITALLGATFTYGIYAQSTIKTFSLTTLFFILAFFVFFVNFQSSINNKITFQINAVFLLFCQIISSMHFESSYLFPYLLH